MTRCISDWTDKTKSGQGNNGMATAAYSKEMTSMNETKAENVQIRRVKRSIAGSSYLVYRENAPFRSMKKSNTYVLFLKAFNKVRNKACKRQICSVSQSF